MQAQEMPVQAQGMPEALTDDDFIAFDAKKAALGQLLFYDPILSGNRNISCGTCHNHDFGGSDGVSLGIGEGGSGIGPKRVSLDGPDRIKKRIPRNTPALWNLGAKQVSVLFHDGRLSRSDLYGNGFNSPAEEWLPKGLDSLLSAQALFPMTSQFEMAGNPRENQIAGVIHDRIDAAWPIVAKQVRTIPGYGVKFVAAFDDVESPEQVMIVHIANALGAFMASEWRSHDSPFDDYLAGNPNALSQKQMRGLKVFYGEGGCSQCHSGKLLADQKFHALALPHFGPGRTRRFDPFVRDVGRMGESDNTADAYRFRTPSLRNAELTAPYGHNGAYPTLEGIIRHHLDPVASFDRWQKQQANLPNVPWLQAVDYISFEDRRERSRLRSKVDITPRELADGDVAALVSFVGALTGRQSTKGRLGKPAAVPSGLKVD
nr:putative methylamine utilization protein MauG [uncultured bacterium]